jgi:hypothetical protein
MKATSNVTLDRGRNDACCDLRSCTSGGSGTEAALGLLPFSLAGPRARGGGGALRHPGQRPRAGCLGLCDGSEMPGARGVPFC